MNKTRKEEQKAGGKNGQFRWRNAAIGYNFPS